MSKLRTISPITSTEIFTLDGATSEELDSKVVPAGVAAQKQWARTSLASRKKIIENYIRLLTEDATAKRLANEITEQMGRPIKYTLVEIKTAALRAQVMLDYAEEALKDEPVDSSNKQFKKYLSREPLGLVLIIFPWNYPYLCLTNGLIPALLAGNAVLIKPSPQTPKVAIAVQELMRKAGLPDGVLQVVHSGDKEVLEALVQNKGISAVAFTGSVEAGLAVQRAAAGRTIPVALELGGKDPAYVRSDIKDIKAVAEDIVDGALFNSGQSCCAIERVYVASDIYDKFVDQVVQVVKGYKLGDPFDEETSLGPVVSEKAARLIRAQILDAVDRGAKKLIPASHFADGEKINPTFVAPQVLVNLDESSSKSFFQSTIISAAVTRGCAPRPRLSVATLRFA
jgi:acyl-CoA reductase-like NAD-dependent aldehyde dehydrogenase